MEQPSRVPLVVVPIGINKDEPRARPFFRIFANMEPVDYRISPTETQIVKAFAIVAMLVHHLFWEHPEYGTVIHHIAIAGKICVALFVFLSGYGMATTFPKEIVGRLNAVKMFLSFLGKRYTKFFMNYWVIFFITVPIGVFCFGRSLETAYGENANILACFFKDMLGQQGFGSYNITWWFNELILTLWILFPLFYCSMRNIFVATGVLLFLFVNPNEALLKLEIFANGLSLYVFLFCLGIFMALHADGINEILNKIPLKAVLFISFAVAIVLLLMRGTPRVPFFSYYRINAFLTVSLVLATVSFCRVTGKKFAALQYIGKHSMNMYLTHTFILGYFWGDFIFSLKFPVAMFVVVFTTSLLVSVIIETVKERIGFYRLQNRIVSMLKT